jgi:hypothetical protein
MDNTCKYEVFTIAIKCLEKEIDIGVKAINPVTGNLVNIVSNAKYEIRQDGIEEFTMPNGETTYTPYGTLMCNKDIRSICREKGLGFDIYD